MLQLPIFSCQLPDNEVSKIRININTYIRGSLNIPRYDNFS